MTNIPPTDQYSNMTNIPPTDQYSNMTDIFNILVLGRPFPEYWNIEKTHGNIEKMNTFNDQYSNIPARADLGSQGLLGATLGCSVGALDYSCLPPWDPTAPTLLVPHGAPWCLALVPGPWPGPWPCPGPGPITQITRLPLVILAFFRFLLSRPPHPIKYFA